jgi:hypothetical protein
MELSLSKLLEVIAPPEGAKGRGVNWKDAEKELGFAFPTSFKEFIAVYGESQWFDLYSSALYPDSVTGVGQYREELQRIHEMVDENGILEDGAPDDSPITLYPEPGGLLFFMSSSDGDYYFWRMEPDDSDQWPMVVWQPVTGLFELEQRTIAELFLSTFEEFRVSQPHRLWAYFTGCGEVKARMKQ